MAVSQIAEAPTAAETQERRDPVLAIYLMALFSGAAALVYEICWARMLALTFGSTTLSASAVIAGFMGGMGLGAWLYHLAGNRFRSPLEVYASLEFGIAATTALVSPWFYRLPEWFVSVSRAGYGDNALLATRFAVVLALLVVPAALMGATFPALCTVLVRSVRGFDRHVGMIYGINTVGAALGAVVAGILLIERLGLSHTVWVANAMNLSIAIAAFWLSRREVATIHQTQSSDTTSIRTTLPRAITGAVLLLSGFTTLSYEIFWFRGLRFIVGNSTYALTIVLVIFLVGLGLGSLGFRWSLRWGTPEQVLAIVQCGIGGLAMVAIGVAWLLLKPGSAHDSVSVFSGALRGMPWWGKLLADAAVAAAVMLPATLTMGLSFPLASRLFLGDVRLLGARVGLAYLLANIGSIAGSVLGAVWLLPTLGALGGTKALALVNLGLGLVIVGWLVRRQRDTDILSFGGATLLFVAVLFFYLPTRFELTGETDVYENNEVIHSVEGDLATVQVLENPLRTYARGMAIDGCVIGVTQNFYPRLYCKQLLLAHLPMVLDTRTKHVLQIGLGSATTLHALSVYPEIESLDCVEINRPVVDAARQFFTEEAKVLDDPRVTVHIEDALYYLLRTDRRYDTIISDGKQNPGFSGNATMLCHDFYRYAYNRLSDRGLFVQWVPQGMLPAEFRIVCRNFCDVFPHGAVFSYLDRAVIFIGSPQPLANRPRLSNQRFESLGIAAALKPYDLHRPDSLLAHMIADRAQLIAQIGPGPLSTWDKNRIEFLDFKAPFSKYKQAPAVNLFLLMHANQQPPGEGAELIASLDPMLYRSCQMVREAYVYAAIGKFRAALKRVSEAMAADPQNSGARAAKRHIESLERKARELARAKAR